MPLSYLARPLFALTVLYILALAVLHHAGYFKVEVPEDMGSLRFRYSVAVEGTVASPLTENRLGERVYVEAQRAGGLPFRQKVLAYLPKAGPLNKSLRPGQAVRLDGRLRFPRRPRNPGEFDERGFLGDRGVGWIMKARAVAVVRGRVSWGWRLRSWAEAARRWVQGRFERSLGPEEAKVMTGLCLGFKGPLSRETNRAIQDAGVMHLLVPSGAKVAFVLLAAECLGRRLFPPAARFLAVGAVGGFYTLMVGADAPYARAFLAWAAYRAASLLGREPGTFQAMTLSALAILMLRPRDLFGAGFQMTYLAVSGLVVAMPRVNDALPRRWPGWVRRSAQVLAVSVIVQAMLWPTFAAYFGRGAVVGALANMVLVPASGLMMGMGFIFAWTAVEPGEPFAWLVAAMVRLFLKMCFWFSSLPFAAVDLAPMSGAGVAVYYLLVLGMLVMPKWKVSAGLMVCGCLLWTGTGLALRARPVMNVTFLRLPKGRAALVSFPEGRWWLVDAGGPAGTVLRALQARGVRSVDKVVITGMDDGKWRGLGRVLANQRCCSTSPDERRAGEWRRADRKASSSSSIAFRTSTRPSSSARMRLAAHRRSASRLLPSMPSDILPISSRTKTKGPVRGRSRVRRLAEPGLKPETCSDEPGAATRQPTTRTRAERGARLSSRAPRRSTTRSPLPASSQTAGLPAPGSSAHGSSMARFCASRDSGWAQGRRISGSARRAGP
ncbi:MAG: ComEC/Rec2 family competence protein [Elusimicrobia bacterium]|nr:ComEC/Rec2 family competence protein [Elusimicrobiota bacterium]